MKKQTKAKKRNPKSEAAQRYVIKNISNYSFLIERGRNSVFIHALHEITGGSVAIFDLRDCYRKRKPLTGITKAMRKAIQPRRKK